MGDSRQAHDLARTSVPRSAIRDPRRHPTSAAAASPRPNEQNRRAGPVHGGPLRGRVASGEPQPIRVGPTRLQWPSAATRPASPG
jgi:hypothetical protein